MAKTNASAEANHQAGVARLEPGRLYDGTIIDIAPNGGHYGVLLDNIDTPLRDCIWACGVFSSLIGIRLSYIPPIGSRVKVAAGSPPAIVGMMPGPFGDPSVRDKQGATTALGSRKKLKGISKETPIGSGSLDETDPYSDQLPGELMLQNIFGVGVQLMTNFAKLSAGDMAKVETHLLHDLVRIVSYNFKHFTAFGDQDISDDGRLNHKTHGTSYPHEAWGSLTASDRKVQASAKGVDFSSIDASNATGRWRYSQYLGWLGNFVHTVVTDPTAVLGRISQNAIRSGKASLHVDSDGSVILNSVADIVIERVVRIPVPIEAKRADDPEGVRVKEFASLDAQFLRLWQQPQNPRDMFETTYQLREYARYLSQFQALCRFHQLEAKKQEYKVPSEAETPAPEFTSKQADVEGANQAAPFSSYDTYACWRIMRDGSIIMWDGFGSSTVMSHGDIRHSATRNLQLDAGGDIRIVAGQNVFIKARRNVEIAAVAGGLRLKARAYWHALCEWGTLWLKSDAQDPKAPGFQAPEPDDAEEDPPIVYNDAAILIDATKGRITTDSARTTLMQVRGPADNAGSDDSDDISASIVLQSKQQHIKLRGKKSVFIQALNGIIGIKARKSIIMRGLAVWMRVRSRVRINNSVDIMAEGGLIKAKILRVNTISAINNVMGPKIPGPSPGGSLHYSHITPLPDDTSSLKPTLEEDTSLTADDAALETVKQVAEDPYPEIGELTWRFDTHSEYVPDPRTFIESPAQQYLRLDKPTVWDGHFKITAPDAEAIKPAPRNDARSAPFPGRGAKQRMHSGGDNLRMPSSKKGAELFKQTKLTTTEYKFQFVSRAKLYE